ncbi:alginate O-acetyltransferase AlgX-related protein [Roseomonas sp. WA12]
MTPSLPALSRRLLLAGAGAAFLPARQAAAQGSAVNGVVIGKDGWLFAQGDAMGLVDPQRVRRVTALIKETVSILRGAKIETVLALTPSRARVYRDMLPDGMRIAASTDARLEQARQDFATLNMLVPDLYTPFTRARAAQPGTPLYFKADTHWMSYGAELAAGEMARAIRGRFRLPASGRPGAQLVPPARDLHVTDLANQLPPGEREKYGAQEFPVRPEAPTGSLLDDDTTDTAAVGNSYMHPRYGFSRALSFSLERPVALHWQIHVNGPYRTMLNYLGGESFKGSKPALLVWDFTEMDMEIMPDRNDVWRANAMPAATFLTEVRRLVGV